MDLCGVYIYIKQKGVNVPPSLISLIVSVVVGK